MKQNKIAVVGIVVVTIISLLCSWFAITLWGNADSFSDKFGILLSVFSIVISVVALVYAMITYYSIDSVQSMNSMEGNVLCNTKYSVAYPESIQYFEDCITEDEFQSRLFDLLLYKKSVDCKQYAEHIQCVIDNIIWIAYANHNDSFYKKCSVLLEKLNSDKQKFKYINSGLNCLFNENIKLISYVINYQNQRIENSVAISRLENIRGRSIENPVAQITFYNYLGLEYRKRADKLLGFNNIFTAENMKKIIEKFQSGEYQKEKAHYSALLDIAEKSFMKAFVISNDDMIWKGYISYNLARVKVMRYLVSPDDVYKADVEDCLERAVRDRDNILYLIWSDSESLSQKQSFLNRKFCEELTRAKKLIAEFSKL